MAKIPFNVDAYTAKLIGRENVANLDGAILELVKNTYDADATVCFLYYEEETDTLYIGDNGSGMTTDIIQKHWMTIGSSSKKNAFTTRQGRIQTGAKGIGRFALDRIADYCTLLTISEEEQLLWTVDWSQFEFGRNITEIEADLSQTNMSFADFLVDIQNTNVSELITQKFVSAGSLFKLTGLRDAWHSQAVKSIKSNLISLIPYEFKTVFNIYLFESSTSMQEAEIFQGTDEISYDYKIRFDAFSDGTVKIEIHRDEFDFGENFIHVMNDAGFENEMQKYFKKIPKSYDTTFTKVLKSDKLEAGYSIGDFSGSLYFSKLATNEKDRKKFFYKDITGRKKIVDSFSGIRIYRDGFRVRPYGEPQSSSADWLMLARRRNKSPSGVAHSGPWCVSSDQIYGSIYISRTNTALPDQANRQGIIETPEFLQLKAFLENVIKMFEKDRQDVCRKLDAYYKKLNPTEGIEEKIKNLALSPISQNLEDSITYKQVSKLVEEKDSTIKQLETELQMLSALATTGIITNTYIHEMKGASASLGLKITMAKEAIELDKNMGSALEYIEEAAKVRNFFTSWFKITVDSIQRDKRRMKSVLLNPLFITLIKAWREVLPTVQIIYNPTVEDLSFKCFPYELETIVNNLIANSTASFEAHSVDAKRITLSVEGIDNGIRIDYCDNGFGLSSTYKENPKEILEAFESSKRASTGEVIGTGMGMWIVNRIVNDYNGRIDFSGNIRNSTGFYATIILKTK